ncbi:MAG: CidA/LrgA family protein [Spirochaetes bacterium]|uniref:CidA/LrgA family protein n=1 Tax=Candidatus Ornithospirochaeta stercoripullorum TaxID=2840899 RepID=A0A9D9H4K3_9SPIO|nr:CidA/LrgA family protein [Candidatus Ornithospirochaeta stercoripullorum]
MKVLIELSLLFVLTLIGEAISSILPFTFPGTLIAMFLLLLLMGLGVIKEEHLSTSASFFSRYMAMFFIPAGVEIIENLEMLKTSWIPLVLISIISLFITFLASAKAVELVEALSCKKKGEEK